MATKEKDHEGDEQLRTSDAENDDKLLNSVEARLANLNEITRDTDAQADEVEDEDDPTPGEEEEEQEGGEEADDDQAGSEDDDDGSTPEKDDAGDNTDEKELPSAFLRAAIHRGWKEEDAVEFFETNPDAAIRTFQNCYMDVNNASKEWARLGKAKAEAGSQKIKADDARPRTESIDVDKLAKDYDLDDATVKALKKQQETIDSIGDQPAAGPADQAPVDPNTMLEIENFFGSASLKDYGKFYGALELGQDWGDLSSGQQANRWGVLEQADMIILGAQAAGVKMTPLEALERAHMVVSEPIRERVIRESIKSTATKRRKSMTIRPSEGTRSAKKMSGGDKEPGTRTREELAEAVGNKLRNVFGS
jgi:hypothetical protein